MRSTFIPDKDLGDKIVESEEVAEGLLPLAMEALKIAYDSAPERLGYYKEALDVAAGTNDDGVAVARLIGYDFKSHWIEEGTGPPQPTPPLHILRSAVEAVVGTVR